MAPTDQTPDDAESDSSQSRWYAIMPAPLVLAITAVPLFNIGEILEDVIMWFMNLLMSAVFGVVGTIFQAGTKQFLMFTPPNQIPGLNEIYMKSLWLYFALLPVLGATFFLTMQLFPHNQDTDPYRLGERMFAATVGVLVMKEGFSHIVTLHNEMIDFFLIGTFNLQFVQSGAQSIAGGALGGLAAVVFAYFASYEILLSVVMFWIMLSMRMILIYTFYGLFPLFMVLWIVDIGPAKYGKMVAELGFKLTAILLIFGIVIAGMMSVTGAIAGGGTDSDVEFAGSEPIVNAEDQQGGEFSGSSGSVDVGVILIKIFAYFGGLWLAIALTSSGFAMVISTRGSSAVKSRARQGRSPDPGTSTQATGGGAGGGATAGSGASAGGGGGGSMDNGSAPEPDNPGLDAEGMATDKAESVQETGEDLQETGESMEETGEAMEDAGEALEDAGAAVGGPAGSVVGAAAGKGVKAAGKGMKAAGKGVQKAGEGIEGAGNLAESATESVSGAVDTVGDKWDDVASRDYDMLGNDNTSWTKDKALKAGSGMKKAGSLAKRGGKAYHNVFKQKGVKNSLAESKRMAEESDIGAPDPTEDMYTADHTGPLSTSQEVDQLNEKMGDVDSGAEQGELADADLDEVDPIGPNGRRQPQDHDQDLNELAENDVFEGEGDWHGDQAAQEDAERRMKHAVKGTQMENALDGDDISDVSQGNASIKMGAGGYGADRGSSRYGPDDGVDAAGSSSSGSTTSGSTSSSTSETSSSSSSDTDVDFDSGSDFDGDSSGGQSRTR